MIQIDLAWLLALPLLFALGWLTAKVDRRQDVASARNHLFQELSKALACLVQGHRSSAMDQLMSVVRAAPEQIDLQIVLGRLLREQGQPDRAIEAHLAVLDRLLETAPETMSEADSTRYRGIRFHLLMELERGSEASAMLPAHPRLALSAETVEEGPYVCASCGYMGRQHAWQCPGCFSWDSMRAVSRS